MTKLRDYLRAAGQNDPGNLALAIFLSVFVLLALIAVLVQTTGGWAFVAALIVFPLWLLLRRGIK